jgi:hypothetical protein
MTITRLGQAGAEHGGATVAMEKAEFTDISTPDAFVPATTIARTGSYSYLFNARYGRWAYWQISATRQIRMGWFLYAASLGNQATGNMLTVRTDTTDLLHLGWSALAEKTSGDINLYFNSSWQGATTSHPILPSTWQHFAIDMKIDSSAGWVKLYIDGNEVKSFTATNTGNDDIEVVQIGSTLLWHSSNRYTYMDDIYLDDTTGESVPTESPPVLRFYYVLPNGNGNYSQWDGSDGDSTNNYQLVDDVPAVATDYVETGVADEYDSYTMGTFTLGSGQTIAAVIPQGIVQRAGNSELIALGTRLSSTDSIGSDQTPAADWSGRFERQTTKPGGGSWAQADLDAFELVLKSRGTY